MAETQAESDRQKLIRERAQALADQFRARHDDPQWFDSLYLRAAEDPALIPWIDLDPNPLLIDWLTKHIQPPVGAKALVVGSGLGDDSEELADWGFHVTAFDISATAVDWCRDRFVGSAVTYKVADLLDPPEQFDGQFDFVLEVYTLQSMNSEVRGIALESLSRFIAPRGVLLMIACGSSDANQSTFSLTRAELNQLSRLNMKEVLFEDFLDDNDPPQRRFRALYAKV